MCMLSGVGLGGMLVQRARRNRDRPAHSSRRDKKYCTLYIISYYAPLSDKAPFCSSNDDVPRYQNFGAEKRKIP